MSRTPPLVSADTLPVHICTNIDNKNKLTETALTTKVSLLFSVYDKHPSIHDTQGLAELKKTVIWFHSHLPELAAHPCKHAQALYISSTLLSRLSKYKTNISFSQSG